MADKRQEQFDLLMGRISSHLPAESVEQLKTVFAAAPEAALQLGEEVLAKSDYTRSIQQVQQEKQQLAQERESLTALSNKVSEYDAYLQTNYLPRADYEAVVLERNKLNSQFEQLSQTYPSLVEELGLPPSQAQQGVPAMPQNPNQPQNPAAPAAPPVNPIQNVTSLQWNQDKQNLAALAMLSPAAQHDLAVRHQQLFNAPLANMTEIVQEAANSGKPLEQVWAEKHDVSGRQQQLQTEQIEQQVQQRVDTELAKRAGAMNVGGIGIPNQGFISPFLQGNRHIAADQLSQPGVGIGGAPDMNRVANQGSGAGVAAQAATAAFLAGKYANDKFDMIKVS